MSMGNKEKQEPKSTRHVLLALRRRKDNPDGKVLCFREVVHDEPVDVERLKVRCRQVPGLWRIHRTVNPRNVERAAGVLQHKLIDHPEACLRMESEWKTALMSQKAKASRLFMLDIDGDDADDTVRAIRDILFCLYVSVHGIHKTPAGYHMVTDAFDRREIQSHIDEGLVEVKTDGYVFLERFEVK